MDFTKYRQGEAEQQRIYDLLRMISSRGETVLDVGARDGYISLEMVELFDAVTALDLHKPRINHEKIVSVQGDVTALDFPDECFDVVVCAEVLEHLPGDSLKKACFELTRVAKEYVLIGVPYKQDIRVGRTTCFSCGKKNPPWGHINQFDEPRLRALFPRVDIDEVSFVGSTDNCTNPLSTYLMDLAGNPYGTYTQEEPCVYCGAKLVEPPPRDFFQKVATKLAFYTDSIQGLFVGTHAKWVHVLFKKREAALDSKPK